MFGSLVHFHELQRWSLNSVNHLLSTAKSRSVWLKCARLKYCIKACKQHLCNISKDLPYNTQKILEDLSMIIMD